jgi:hypothetical protein
MTKYFKKAAAGLLMTGASMLAFADCESTLSSYSFYITYDPAIAAELKAQHPACFGSSATGSSQQINATSFTQAAAISQSIGARLSARQGGAQLASNGIQGLSAGDVQQPWNIWGSLNQNDSSVSYTIPTLVQKIKGSNDVQNTILGADYALNPAMVVGLSVAFDDGDGWSRNVTGAGPKIKNSTDGYIVAPYFGYQLNKEFALDISAGLGNADSSTATTKADVDRWFAAANLSYNRWMDNLQFTGKLSYLHGDEDVSDAKSRTTGLKFANTDSSSAIDQIRLGAQVGYWMNGIMPYAGLSYTSNFSRSGAADDDPAGRSAFVATLGLNFFSLSSKVSGGIMYEQELDRDHSNNDVITANINFRF